AAPGALMGPDAASRVTVPGYGGRPTTKAPNWHGLVTLDLLFNNLSTGLFIVMAVGELVQPAGFRPLAPLAYPIALLFLVADLVCLVLDLGDPSRFHHMLRVWKPGSPMSLGTWLLTAYSAPLTLLAAMSVLPVLEVGEWLRATLLLAGLLLAIGAAVYKGVLFSTTAQRGWGDARWLGGYLINSALVLGAGQVILLAHWVGLPGAVGPLRLALLVLLPLNLLVLGLLVGNLRGPLAQARGGRLLAVIGVVAVAGGILAPLGLLALGTPLDLGIAVLLILVGAMVVRHEMVRLPHALGQARPGG
ncbi:MAG TPA: NrfD/PsrC family molybdoenzyme membrane anchor subunit, partial [Gemmatimonadales bacterium]|nr:NrfD/PsrC family molybdoenzyme membrane anchor subunit [Gemmatimonadales bacterium]